MDDRETTDNEAKARAARESLIDAINAAGLGGLPWVHTGCLQLELDALPYGKWDAFPAGWLRNHPAEVHVVHGVPFDDRLPARLREIAANLTALADAAEAGRVQRPELGGSARWWQS